MFILIGALTSFNLLIVLYEEPPLRSLFDQEYEDYRRTVRRW